MANTRDRVRHAEAPTTELSALAQLAVEGGILGGSGPLDRRRRGALLRPLDIVLAVLAGHPEIAWEDLLAAAAEDVYRHLSRTQTPADHTPPIDQTDVTRFVHHILDSILGEFYAGDLNRLLADGQFVRSAYTWHIRQAIAAGHQTRSQAARDPGNSRIA